MLVAASDLCSDWSSNASSMYRLPTVWADARRIQAVASEQLEEQAHKRQ